MPNVTDMKNGYKILRVKEGTFERLTNTGKWSDSMDEIINNLLDKAGA